MTEREVKPAEASSNIMTNNTEDKQENNNNKPKQSSVKDDSVKNIAANLHSVPVSQPSTTTIPSKYNKNRMSPCKTVSENIPSRHVVDINKCVTIPSNHVITESVNDKKNQESQVQASRKLAAATVVVPTNNTESTQTTISVLPRSSPTKSSTEDAPLELTVNSSNNIITSSHYVDKSTGPMELTVPITSSLRTSSSQVVRSLSSSISLSSPTPTVRNFSSQGVKRKTPFEVNILSQPMTSLNSQTISKSMLSSLSSTSVVTSPSGELVSIPAEFLPNSNHMIIRGGGHNAMDAALHAGAHQIIVQDEDNNVISIPEHSFPTLAATSNELATLKLENGSRLQLSSDALSSLQNGCPPPSNIAGLSLSGANVISIPEPITTSSVQQLPTAPHPIKIEPTNGMTARPPSTELLLKTAKNMLQLSDEDHVDNYKRVFPGSILEVDEAGTILSSTTAPNAINENIQEMEVDENETYILESVEGGEQLYAEDPNIMWIEETVEVEQEAVDGISNNMVIILNPNGTVNEELMLANGFNLDTIKAMSEAVSGGVQIPEPTAPAVTPSAAPPPSPTNRIGVARGLGSGGVSLGAPSPSTASITSLQHPIPKKLLAGIEPIMTAALPSGVLPPPSGVLPPPSGVLPPPSSKSSPVILDSKQVFLQIPKQEERILLNDIKDPLLTQEELCLQQPTTSTTSLQSPTQTSLSSQQVQQLLNSGVMGGGQFIDSSPGAGDSQLAGKIITINGQHHLITTSKPLPQLRRIGQSQNVVTTPLGTLDLSLPKKEDLLTQYVNPTHLVQEHGVLKVLDQSELMKGKRGGADGTTPKIKRQRLKDENGNGTYINRKTTSLGALGQALHGMPRDSRENAVQICPLCKFQATTKNPYRHLQDHLARVHFKDRIAAELPTKKPYVCPFEGCDGKQYPDWQAVMRHYIGKKHGILDKYVREEIAQTGVKLPEHYVSRPTQQIKSQDLHQITIASV